MKHGSSITSGPLHTCMHANCTKHPTTCKIHTQNQAALKHMKPGSSIINTTSVVAYRWGARRQRQCVRICGGARMRWCWCMGALPTVCLACVCGCCSFTALRDSSSCNLTTAHLSYSYSLPAFPASGLQLQRSAVDSAHSYTRPGPHHTHFQGRAHAAGLLRHQGRRGEGARACTFIHAFTPVRSA